MQQVTLSLHNIIDQVGREKGIDPKILIETMEQAILTAAKRTFGVNRELEVRFNEESGQVDLFQYMTVVEQVEDAERQLSAEDAERYGLEAEVGEELGFQIFYLEEDGEKARQQDKEFGDLLNLKQARKRFGRIAAQTAKQVIIQRIRDAERELIYEKFKDRKGEIITGIVRRIERGSNLIVDLGRTEAVLPQKFQTPRETYRPGDRIVAFVADIDREARGPQIVLSRTDVGLLIKLFEMEVPEIYEGIVRIVAAAREPGARSKIAVSSRDSDVDPVGACVGMKGSRVQAVVQELRGEKIDIVPWDRDPARFVCNAIAPADIARVIIDETNGAMELVVPDDKLSLAIGRRGQNVRLASQLTGWKLDVIGESKFKTMEQEAITGLASIEGIDERVAMALYKQGFRTVDEVAEAANQEFSGVETLIGAENTASLKRRAEEAVERIRLEHIESAAVSPEPLTDRETLQLVRGVTPRIAELIIHAGYKSVHDLSNENDIDRLAIKTGLGIKKARKINEGVIEYMEKHAPLIEEGQRLARERAEREAREQRLLEEAQNEQQADASGGESEASDTTDTGVEGPETPSDEEQGAASVSDPAAVGGEIGKQLEKDEQNI